MRDVLVLCYHAVSEEWTAVLSIKPDLFERQLELILARGYKGATFHEALTAPPAPKTVAVTFDDGFRSVSELAFPIMSRLGLPGTMFVPTALIDSERPMAWPGVDEWLGGPFEHELLGMSWDQVGQLSAAGWEIGSHSCTHPHLPALEQDELERELSRSREDCERMLGIPCRSLAYPYGDVDDRVLAAAGQAGYAVAAGLPGQFEPLRRLDWPREGIYVYDEMPKFRRKVSPWLRRARRSRAWPLADRARRRLRGR